MATRRTSRQTARRRRHQRAQTGATKPLYRRPLRYEPLEDRWLLALVTVDTLADTVDFNDGRTSLREAIFATNLVSGPDTIEFAPSLTSGGPASILLTHGELRISDTLAINGPGASLLTFDASGSDSTPNIDDGRGTRIFNIDDGSPTTIRIEVSISGLTLTGGDVLSNGGGAIRAADAQLTVANSTISNNSSDSGAGVYLIRSTATFFQSIISKNTGRIFSSSPSAIRGFETELSIIGSTIYENEGAGVVSMDAADTQIVDSSFINNDSGIHISNTGRTTTISSTFVSGNNVRGGIHVNASDGGSTTITNSTISNNETFSPAAKIAGGITILASLGSVTTVADSTISGNTGPLAGGVLILYGTATITQSLINDNRSRFGPAPHGSGGIFIANVESATISDCHISNNAASYRGGGISAITGFEGNIQISRCTITGNTALEAAGVFAFGRVTVDRCLVTKNSAEVRGGGIWVLESGASVVRSTVSNNSAGRWGGGIYGSSSSVVDATISGNTAGDRGGGIHASGMTIRGSTISENSADSGGGIWLAVSTAHESTISGNSAVNGGGIHSSYASRVTHSTVAFNEASGFGGGVFVGNGALTLTHAIVAQNTASAGNDITGLLIATITPHYSLIGHNSGSGLTPAPISMPDANGNLIGGPISAGGRINPLLGPLGANGGPTQTHALLPTSPAINAGDPSAVAGAGDVPLFDQRGEPFARVSGGRIDMGAFEAQPNPLPGDYNFNGSVDLADYAVWRDTMGSTADLRADGNEDGIVDAADHAVWRANYGRTRESEQQEAGGSDAVAKVKAAAKGLAILAETLAVNAMATAASGTVASSVIVTTLSDTVDFNDGRTSLREAIFATNLVGGADTIQFAPSLTASGPSSILLTQGQLQITDHLTIDGPGSSRLTINAQQNSRIFDITAPAPAIQVSIQVSIAGLTLTGGRTTGNNPPGDSRQFSGGAIRSLSNQVLTVSDTHLIANSTTGSNARGGAIYAFGPVTLNECIVNENSASGAGSAIFAGTVTLNHCTVSGNDAIISSRAGASAIRTYADITLNNTTVSDNAGVGVSGNRISLDHSEIRSSGTEGIFAQGIVTLIDSSVADNGGTGIFSRSTFSDSVSLLRSNIRGNAGGGILSSFGGVVLTDSSVSDNERGGGVFTAGDVTLHNSTVANNQVSFSFARGAGIRASGNVTLNQSTISGNVSGGNGGGIYSLRNVTLNYSTVTNNSAALIGGGILTPFGAPTIAINGSIVAGNTAVSGMADIAPGPATLVVHHSLIGDNNGTSLAEAPVGLPDANGNLIGGPVHGVIDPLLGPLADNGGPTQTHALLAGSPAINAGDLNSKAGMDGVPQFDQRGEPFGRVVNGRIDIGAFEFQAPSDLNLLVDTLVDESDGNHGRGDLSLREALELANMWPSDDTIRFDSALAATGLATIVLTKGELKITDDVTIVGLGAEILTVDASGNDPTPQNNDRNGSRVFQIAGSLELPAINVSMSGITLTGGDLSGAGGAILNSSNLTLQETRILGNHAGELGGGIYHKVGTLRLIDSIVAGNSTGGVGGGIHSISNIVVEDSDIQNNVAGGHGGGIAFVASGNLLAELSVTGSRISFNSATLGPGRGGGIYFQKLGFSPRTGLSVSDTEISHNGAPGGGAGLWVQSVGGTMTLENNTIFDNIATQNSSTGGGIYANLTNLNATITGNTVRENSAGSGGGIWMRNVGGQMLIDEHHILNNRATAPEGTGGGLHFANETAMVTLQNSRVEGNSAGRGGGIRAGGQQLTIRGSVISGNVAEVSGGGILNNTMLQLVDSIIAGNSARGPKGTGGGIIQAGIRDITITNSHITGNSAVLSGGGLYVPLEGGNRITINGSTISENSAGRDGGGIMNHRGSLTVNNSTFANNTAGRDGGAIHNQAPLTLSNNFFQSNHAGRDGGGLLSNGGRATLIGDTFAGNTAERNGGGIAMPTATLTMTNSTLSGNTAGELGGGIWGATGPTLGHSTIFGNQAGIAGGGVFVNVGFVNLKHMIVAGNNAPSGRDLSAFLGTIIDVDYSLIGSNAGTGLMTAPVGLPDANGNLIGGPSTGTLIDPRLGPLANNGGPTDTHALLPNSPAINAGDPSFGTGPAAPLQFDQRGAPFARVHGGRIDMGAFERQPNPLPGDYNFNGIVDLADYAVWRDTIGSITDLRADGNEDGIVDAEDHAIWRANFGNTRENVQQGGGSLERRRANREQFVPSRRITFNTANTAENNLAAAQTIAIDLAFEMLEARNVKDVLRFTRMR